MTKTFPYLLPSGPPRHRVCDSASLTLALLSQTLQYLSLLRLPGEKLSSMGQYESHPQLGPADISNPIVGYPPILPLQFVLMKCMCFIVILFQPSAFAHHICSA